MDRNELLRNFQRTINTVQEHNNSNFVAAQRIIRNGIIDNADNYRTANVNHEIQSIQVPTWTL